MAKLTGTDMSTEGAPMSTTEEERELEVTALQKRLIDPADEYVADDRAEGTK